MRRLAAVVLLCAAFPALAQTPYPFEGAWDCEVGTFRFTAETYDPGDGAMDILDVAEEDGVYLLTFADDYQLGLSMNADGSMEWFSAASGDSFTCRALD